MSHGVFLVRRHFEGTAFDFRAGLLTGADPEPGTIGRCGAHNCRARRALTASPKGGQSLVPILKGASKDLPAYSETYYTNLLMGWAPLHSLRWSNKKWIDAPKPELYNLTADPKELKNIYSSSSISTAARSELNQHLTAKTNDAQRHEVDPETKEKLASLGYITGSSPTPVSSTFDPKDGIGVWEKIETAVQYAESGDTKKSEQLFLSALQQQPDNVIALKFLANLYRTSGQPEKAVPLLQKALQSKLHNEETRYDLAESYYELQKYSDAMQTLAPLLKDNSSDSRVLRLAAASLLNSGEYRQSAVYFEKLLSQHPDDSDTLANYAIALSQLKEDTKAIQTYRRLASLRPLKEQEAIQAAAICLTSNQPELAEEFFQAAVHDNPDSIPAWKGISLIRLSKGQLPEAMEAALKANDCEEARIILKQSDQLPPDLLEAYKKKCP